MDYSGGIAEKRKDEKEENCCKRKGDNRIIIKKYSFLHRVFDGGTILNIESEISIYLLIPYEDEKAE